MLNVPTLRDVALRASVSVPIVSRVLAGEANVRVRPDTRERILRAAEELNYRPNVLARSLKTRKTHTLALLIPDVGNPVFPAIVRGVEEEAARHGYTVLISHIDERAIEQKFYMTLFQESRFDGLLLATARLEDSVIDDLNSLNCPFVLLNRATFTTNNFVIVDDTLGSRLAVDHLIELGHRRIAHLAGPFVYDTALRRFQGYRQSLARNGLDYDPDLVEEVSWFSYEGGRLSLAKLMKRCSPTAIFAGNLTLAIGAVACLRDAGLAIPGDVSVIGLHDAPLAEVLNPPLTVVRMPLEEMGRNAVASLVGWLDGLLPIVPQMLAPLGLVERASTGPPRQTL